MTGLHDDSTTPDDTCPVSPRKRLLRTRRAARIARDRRLNRLHRDGGPIPKLTIYPCRAPGRPHWHLTSDTAAVAHCADPWSHVSTTVAGPTGEPLVPVSADDRTLTAVPVSVAALLGLRPLAEPRHLETTGVVATTLDAKDPR